MKRTSTRIKFLLLCVLLPLSSNKCGVVCRVGRSWNYVRVVHRDMASDWQEWWLLAQLQLRNPTLLCTVYLWGTLLYPPVTSFCITNTHTSLQSALTISSLHPVSRSQQLQSQYSIIIHLSCTSHMHICNGALPRLFSSPHAVMYPGDMSYINPIDGYLTKVCPEPTWWLSGLMTCIMQINSPL